MSTKTQSSKALADPELMALLLNKVSINSSTGLPDIDKFMKDHPDEMEKLMQHVDELAVNDTDTDLSTFDYSKLQSTIVNESFWCLQIEPMGYVDSAGRPIEGEAIHKSGAKPTFVIYCYDDSGAFRVSVDCAGLPTSDVVLRTIQRAIAQPSPPLEPALPWFLLVSIKLAQHVDALRPFLDSLPKPFHWRLETSEEAEGVRNGVDQLNQMHIPASMNLAEEAKVAGNKAYAEKDKKLALGAYAEAIKHINDAISQNPSEEQLHNAKTLLAICLSNVSAAHMLPVPSPEPALESGKAAEAANPYYAKSYVRQSSALVALGRKDEAIEVLIRALKKEELEDESGLVDRLIGLLTDGKGLSDDEGVFKQWMIDIIINEKRPFAKSLIDIKGEYKRRIGAQFAKFPKRTD